MTINEKNHIIAIFDGYETMPGVNSVIYYRKDKPFRLYFIYQLDYHNSLSRLKLVIDKIRKLPESKLCDQVFSNIEELNIVYEEVVKYLTNKQENSLIHDLNLN